MSVEPARHVSSRYSATAKLSRVEVLLIRTACERMQNDTLSSVESALLADTLDHLSKIEKQFEK